MRSHAILTPERCRHVYLTGFMGAGKTTIGQALAERLGWQFFDLDHQVELKHGMSIAEIWSLEGEAMFRRWENEAFADLALEEGHAVIATGGGTLIDPVNFDLAHRTGVTVYLVADFAAIMQRIDRHLARPLVMDGDEFVGADALRRLFHHRLPFYRMSEVHVDAVHGTVPEIVDRVLAAVPPLEIAAQQEARHRAARVEAVRQQYTSRE